jgi:hypothetical protein
MSPAAADLFDIDVAAEIRKLAGRRFRTPGDHAVELVRHMASLRPPEIRVRVSRRSFSVAHDGEGLVGATVKRLAAVFDPRRADADRHEALVALERELGLGLLAPFAVERARVRLEGLVDGRPRGLELRLGHPPKAVPSGRAEGFVITVRGAGRRPALEKRLLREACRHSLRPIFLNGERINRGLLLENTLLHVDLQNPRLQAVVGLPLESDLVRISRLRHGVLVEELVRAPANGMVFHAIVDERTDDLDATWNTLRRAARKLYENLPRRYPELSGRQRERAARLLLDRFVHTREAGLLLGVPLFARLGGKAALDLESLRRLAAETRVHALAPDESSRGFDVDGREVLRIGGQERRFLERELARSLTAPPRRPDAIGLQGSLARFFRDRWRAVTRALGGGPGRPVPDRELSPPELAFLEALRAEVRSGAFSLGEDLGSPFHIGVRFARDQRRPLVRVERDDGRTEFRVARGHPLVERCVEAVDDDPSWVYPVLLLLAEGRDGYGDGRKEAQAAILARHRAG